jgi:hypothetical protein
MDVRWTKPGLGISFNIIPVIRSHPGPLLWFGSSCIVFRISFGVRNLVRCVIGSGSFSALLISDWRVSFVTVYLV